METKDPASLSHHLVEEEEREERRRRNHMMSDSYRGGVGGRCTSLSRRNLCLLIGFVEIATLIIILVVLDPAAKNSSNDVYVLDIVGACLTLICVLVLVVRPAPRLL